jgi:hypothetical protein
MAQLHDLAEDADRGEGPQRRSIERDAGAHDPQLRLDLDEVDANAGASETKREREAA